MTTLLVNDLRAVSVRLFHPWEGAWTAEVDFDLSLVPTVPSGRVLLKINETILQGTIDPDASGRFGEKARARVIAGGGGWHKDVLPLQLHNDGGILSSAVIAVTAAEVGETAVVVVPARLGVDYMRTAGPASRVLAGLDWYVTLAGLTTVGPRAPLPMAPDVQILTWDPHENLAEIAYDGLITPGTVLVDPRFGTATVRDVEQTFGDGGARARAWCSPATETGSTKLITMLRSLTRESAGVANLKTYRYRVVSQTPPTPAPLTGRVTLQAIDPTIGAPHAIEVPIWYGVPGIRATLTPGTECGVVFLDGDPAQPAVVCFKDDSGAVKLAIGTGVSPVALAQLVELQLQALKAAISAAPIVPLDGGAAFKASLIAQLAAWPAPVGSTKLFSD